MDKRPKIIMVYESLAQSVMMDVVTLITLIIPIFLNHRYWGGNIILDIIFVILVIGFWLNYNSPAIHKFYSIEDARDFLNSEEVKADEYDR